MSLQQFLRLAPDQDLRFAATLIDEIDSILTIDYLDTYLVSRSDLGGLEGLTDASRPASIKISPDCERKSLVFAHEIGHVVDFSQNLILSALAGQTSELYDLIWSVQESDRARFYEQLRRTYPNPDVRAIAADLLQPTELWARCFAQYIATRLPNSATRNELEASLKMDPASYILDYWDPVDFEPIGEAIERILRKWEWM